MIHEALLVAMLAFQAAATPAARPYTMSVSDKDGFLNVTITAENARLADLAADLSKRLRARVVLGPSLQNELVTATVSESLLEPALLSLAPKVLIDYEIRQDARPTPHDIYLFGTTDNDPPIDAVAKGMSQGLMIEGHTEDAPTAQAEDPLQVTGDRTILSVTSKKVPLSIVARAISDVTGVPVDIRYDATELVEMDIRNARLEDIIPRLSPNVRFYVRVDAVRLERTPIRVVIAPPSPRR